MLRDLGVPAFKLGSGQVVSDIQLIREAASERVHIIISAGLGGYEHVEKALKVCLEEGNEDVAVLHCISEYPTATEDAELRRIQRLRAAFGAVTGYSDHTESATLSAAAVALEADIIEKHITLDRTSDGPDHGFAIEPDTFKKMVDGIREVETALGAGVKLATAEGEKSFRDHVQMKLVAAKDIRAGSTLTNDAITARRSPRGISRNLLSELERSGVSVKRDLKEGSLITWGSITGDDD
jgi:sialic acid synthase SpsE